DINAGMLNKLLTELRSKGLTNASINRVRALLSVMFNMAINHDLIQVNPVSKVPKKEPPTSFQKLKEKLKKEKMRSST
ncbi:hypothetical protein ABTP22_19685, partial [Acinetobacter baumannii]